MTSARSLLFRLSARRPRALVLAALTTTLVVSGTAATAQAAPAIGVYNATRPASIDAPTGALVGGLLSGLSGTDLSLTTTDWSALEQGRVKAPPLIDGVAAAASTTHAGALTANVTLPTIFAAAAAAAQTDGDTPLTTALSKLASQTAALTGTIRLGDWLGVAAGDPTVTDASVNGLDLAVGLIERFNYDVVSGAATPATISGEALGLASAMDSVQLSGRVVTAPAYVRGDEGATFHSAGLRLKFSIDLVDLTPNTSTLTSTLAAALAGVATVQSDATIGQAQLYGSVAAGQGVIDAIGVVGQAVTLKATPGAVDLYAGAISDALFSNRARAVVPATDLTAAAVGSLHVVLKDPMFGTTLSDTTTNIVAKTQALGSAPLAGSLAFDGSFPDMRSTGDSTATSTAAVAALTSDLSIALNGSQGPLLDPLVNTLTLPVLTPIVSGALDPALGTLLTSLIEPSFRASGSGFGNSTASVDKISDPDVTPPAVPTIASTSPVSPSQSLTPRVQGATEGGSTVTLYASADCTGPSIGSANALDFGNPGIAITVAANASISITGTASDAAGNVSDCSTLLNYTNDLTAPAQPVITSTFPASPSRNMSASVLGTAETGSVVKLWDTTDCTGVPIQSGTAAAFANPGLSITVPADSTTVLRATATDAAGNESACPSAGLSYKNDRTAPAVPSALSSTPASPSSSLTPKITGTAAAGSTVKLYLDCSGAPTPGTEIATGTGAAFAAPGFQLNVAADSETVISATATDTAGNESDCSTSYTYVNASVPDTTAPDAPVLAGTSPGSPSREVHPTVSGSAEAGSTVTLYASDDCSGAPLATGTAEDFSSPGLAVTVGADATTPLTATATDAANNPSDCSATALTYTTDNTPPDRPAITAITPDSPSSDTHPHVAGLAQDGSTVHVYGTADCSGGALATGTAASFGTTGFAISVPLDATTAITADAVDELGNTSSCSGSRTYVHKSADVPAPPAPLIPGPPAGGPAGPPPPQPQPQPQPQPSNSFAHVKPRVKGTKLTMPVDLPSGGQLELVVRYSVKGKSQTYAKKTKTLSSGKHELFVTPSSKAGKALKKTGKLKVKIQLMYTPAGGVPRLIEDQATVKAASKR